MGKDNMLTQERLKELLRYDPETGVWYRLKRVSSNAAEGDIAGVAKERYYYISVDGKEYLSHRLAVFYMTGKWPAGEVDHKDRNTFYNAWDNLRDTDRSTNCHNTKLSKANTSGHKGIYWSKKNSKWYAQIVVNRKTINLGYHVEIDYLVSVLADFRVKNGLAPY